MAAVVVHAAIIAINDAVDRCVAATTLSCLLNPTAHLMHVIHELSEDYQSALYDAKQIKKEIAINKVTYTTLRRHITHIVQKNNRSVSLSIFSSIFFTDFIKLPVSIPAYMCQLTDLILLQSYKHDGFMDFVWEFLGGRYEKDKPFWILPK